MSTINHSTPPRTYVGRVSQALSQLGNALANGNPDVSISARIGQKRGSNWYWRFATNLVDFTFYPLEGKGHCDRAWNRETKEIYLTQGHWLSFVVLTALFTTFCILLIPVTWTIGYPIYKAGKS